MNAVQTVQKVYVDVNVDVHKDGTIRPKTITWTDGRIYEIDRLIKVCRAASTRAGGCGMRYTVSICGQETFLFNEADKWFVEGKVYKA